MGRIPWAPAEGKDEIDLDDLLEDDEGEDSGHSEVAPSSQHVALASSLNLENVANESLLEEPVQAKGGGLTDEGNPWTQAEGENQSHVSLEVPSLESIMKDEAQREQLEAKEATRMAEIAQEEELVRIAMEMSLTDLDIGSLHSSTSNVNTSEDVMSICEYEQEQFENALRVSRQQHVAQVSTLGTLEEEEIGSSSVLDTSSGGNIAFVDGEGPECPTKAVKPPLGGKQSSLSALAPPRTPLSRPSATIRRSSSFNPSPLDDIPSTPSSVSSRGSLSGGYRSPLLRQAGATISLEELSPADFTPKSNVRSNFVKEDVLSSPRRLNCPAVGSSLRDSKFGTGPKLASPSAFATLPMQIPSMEREMTKKPLGNFDLLEAEKHLSATEIRQIEQALKASQEEESVSASEATAEPAPITDAEATAIEKALREADEEAESKSLLLALKIQQEEQNRQSRPRQPLVQGNVRTMTRAQFAAEQNGEAVGAFRSSGPIQRHPLEDEEEARLSAGFRINSINPQQWARRDQNSIVGPNNEVRTKHDAELLGQANAHRLGLETDDGMALVGNKAYNSFMQSVRQKTKGVASHGTGRAGSDADSTKGGAMDPAVRVLIAKAINNGLIEVCNGVVKEGKEAIVYHADKGEESEGHDVAVKVFKRIQEFRSRGDYVDGDPRYARANFRGASNREQLELWSEKEFRNLMRANRAGVPVPTPLMQKDNVLFMRFLGSEGWPSPQLRELDIRRGSSKWKALFTLCLEAIQRLYTHARLVHCDLSEYNILVAPSHLVDNPSAGVGKNDLQPVLIDFGQAVDIRHPSARSLLERDVDRVIAFFRRQGIDTMHSNEAISFVLNEAELKTI